MQAGYQSLAATLFAEVPPQKLAAFATVLEQVIVRLRQAA
jgi:hypothetical protein